LYFNKHVVVSVVTKFYKASPLCLTFFTSVPTSFFSTELLLRNSWLSTQAFRRLSLVKWLWITSASMLVPVLHITR